jgi:hypothetical protein
MRAIGALSMSVGTSLAFELGGDVAKSADTLLFNLRTLVRNAMQSYEKEDDGYNNELQLIKDVESDLVLISKWVEENRKAKPIQMIVYYPTYKSLKSKFKHADIYEPKVQSKKEEQLKILGKVAEAIAKKYKKVIVEADVDLPAFTGKGVIMTHHVVDLTTTPSTGRLFLLESHTGVIKDFTQWYTKLTGGDKLNYMPFNHLTIQIFGDNSTNFKSSSHGIKELVKRIAAEAKWTSATSISRVRNSIGSIAQGVDRAGLMMMC